MPDRAARAPLASEFQAFRLPLEAQSQSSRTLGGHLPIGGVQVDIGFPTTPQALGPASVATVTQRI